ncbi:MAG: hypothetical protein CUN54_09565, partial [Phototrophicales bacterium]
INFDYCESVTDQLMVGILQTANRHLRYISLRGNTSQRPRISDATLFAIAKHCATNLHTLRLRGHYDQFTDAAMASILSKARQLRIFDPSNCRNLTDTGLSAIVNQSKLKIVNLEGLSNVSDKLLLKMLTACKELKQIGLSGTPISDASILKWTKSFGANRRADCVDALLLSGTQISTLKPLTVFK